MKPTLTKRISDIEQESLTVNAHERLEELERFMKAIRDGKLLIIPHPRFKSLEDAVGVKYKINKSGKYIKTCKKKKTF